MNCPNCHNVIADGSNFCSYCGAKIMQTKTDWIGFILIMLSFLIIPIYILLYFLNDKHYFFDHIHIPNWALHTMFTNLWATTLGCGLIRLLSSKYHPLIILGGVLFLNQIISTIIHLTFGVRYMWNSVFYMLINPEYIVPLGIYVILTILKLFDEIN